MTERVDPEEAMKMAADIVIAYLNRGSLDPDQLPALVRDVRAALIDQPQGLVGSRWPSGESDSRPKAAAAVEPAPADTQTSPAVPIDQSVLPDYIISLEDGARYRSLRRHLMARYGMTPGQYRAKWGLPPDYPMVAPSYSQARSEVAKKIGLGKLPAVRIATPARAKSRSRAKAG